MQLHYLLVVIAEWYQ